MKNLLLIIICGFFTNMLPAQSTENNSSQINITSDSDSVILDIDGVKTSFSNKDLAQYFLANGIDYANNQDYENAQAQFKTALLYDLVNDEILYNLGLSEYYLKNYGDAIKCFDNALDINPANADYYNMRGLCKAMLENFDGAESDFKIALIYDKNFPMGNYNYGILLLEKGDYENACEYLHKADALSYPGAAEVIENYCN